MVGPSIALAVVMTRSTVILLAVSLPLTACRLDGTDSPPTPLAQQTDVTVGMDVNHGSLSMVGGVPPSVHVSFESPHCFRIGDDVSATFDGMPMDVVAQGGHWETNDGWRGCILPELVVTAHEFVAQPHSRLVVTDATATWTIELDAAYANDFTVDSTPLVAGDIADVVWGSAD